MITTTDYKGIRVTDADAISKDLEGIANKKISEIHLSDYPNLLIFPDSFCAYDRDFGGNKICTIKDGKLYTESIVGFVGRNNTQLSITSRFAKDGSDLFLHYMLQKVLKINLLNLPHGIDDDTVFDFLIYLFPSLLKKAVNQGVFKKYVTRHHNDSNVRGIIDINRHIKDNVPFVGQIAYHTREYSFDNSVTQLIRHTIEYIARTPLGKGILQSDDETRQAVRIIMDATPSFSHGRIQQVINDNLHPVSHPLYSEYRNLQKLCLRILRHEELKYGNKDTNRIYGVLIDAAWLWEEYLADVLKSKFNHYTRESSDKFYLFEGDNQYEEGIQQIIPDYLTENKTIVADAKYIPLDKIRDKRNIGEESATDIYYKTIAYMCRFNAKTGYLLYPLSSKKTDKMTYTIPSAKKEKIIKFGLRIPHNCNDFSSFSIEMLNNEETFLQKFDF